MKARESIFPKAALFVGLILLTACTTTGNPTSKECNQKSDSCNVLTGYYGNAVSGETTGATIAGGGQDGAPNQVTGNFGTVGGGNGNLAGEGSTVSGGSANTAIHFQAVVGGGANNLADGQEATVGGGYKNIASERFATVGGGLSNTASDLNATVAGGSGNMANNRYATVGGGTQNLASSVASVVSGGDYNQAQGAYSSVLGGANNHADGYISAIGGGTSNVAGGAYAVIPGGFSNQAAGDYSFAAGRSARVDPNHPGAFLFADSSNFPFPSLGPNEFAVRATGGVRFVTALDDSGNPLAGVRLSPGSGTWESLSDYNAKAGFESINERQILERLMTVPISSWYYRGQDASVRHIGPMAQDFYATFNVGQDNRYISTVDEEGIALAAIQALYRVVQENNTGMISPESESLLQQQQGQIISLERRLMVSESLAVASLLIAVVALWRRTPLAQGDKNREFS